MTRFSTFSMLVAFGLLAVACSQEPQTEICDDGIDNDMDELIDELDDDCQSDDPWGDDDTDEPTGDDDCAGDDSDCDGWADNQDCAPNDPSVNPDALEVCDGVDNDCDGDVDELDECADVVDSDGDGWADDQDCEPNNGSVNPGALEVCDGVDNDCDGSVDELDECSETDPTAAEDCSNGVDDDGDSLIDLDDADCDYCADNDGDGYAEVEYDFEVCDGSLAGDCDDSDAAVNPGQSESAGNGIDDDCDGFIDADFDGDGELGTADGGDDCDDNDAAVNTSAVDVVNEVDDDCDEQTDPLTLTWTLYGWQPYALYMGQAEYSTSSTVVFNVYREQYDGANWWPSVDLNAISGADYAIDHSMEGLNLVEVAEYWDTTSSDVVLEDANGDTVNLDPWMIHVELDPDGLGGSWPNAHVDAWDYF